MEANIIGLAGIVASAPELHHDVYGQKDLYAVWLDMARESKTIDRVLVLFQEDKIETATFGAQENEVEEPGARAALIEQGAGLEVTGIIQTYKDRDTGRIQLFVWARYVANFSPDGKQLNTAYITGEVGKPPVYRETPKKRQITDITVRVPSEFAPGFCCSIPCIAWEENAKYAATLEAGETVYLEGRLQSRPYDKRTPEGVKQLTTWEVSISKIYAKEQQDNGN